MIILDYNGIAVSNIFVQHSNDILSEDLLRHMVLNSIKLYNSKFRGEYGQMYIACDHSSWRKEFYQYYKANRKKGRDSSSMDWNSIFDWLGTIRRELDEYSPYKVIHMQGAEADDIIATLVERTQEFGKGEPVMIISSDQDFLQLQKYSNVKQFSSIMKKPLTESDPHYYLFEHVVRGDSGDGVPNIFSDDDTFVNEEKRQSPISKKKLEALYKGYQAGKMVFDKVEHERNFHRNQRLIDLSKIPDEVKAKILTAIAEKEQKPKPNSNAFLNYLIKKRCTKHIESITEFF